MTTYGSKEATRLAEFFDQILHPVSAACDVLIQTLGDELREIEQRRADLHATPYTLRKLRADYGERERTEEQSS